MFEPAKKLAKRFKVALFGDAKTGKTITALSFPKPAVLDLEKGSILHADSYDFKVREIRSWGEFEKVIDWIAAQKDPGFQTLVIDPATLLWHDLVDGYAIAVQERRDRGDRRTETLTQADWGTIKRRWNRAMFKLMGLDVHVVMIIREKEEMEAVDGTTGKEFVKTGTMLMDAEKNLKYVFDFIVHTEMEEYVKGAGDVSAKGKRKLTDQQKVARYFLTVKGSRRKELPKYSRFEVTDKNAYKLIFEPLEKIVNSGESMAVAANGKKDKAQQKLVDPVDSVEVSDEEFEKATGGNVTPPATATPPAAPAPETKPPEPPKKMTHEEAVAQIDGKFGTSKFASAEDPNAPISTTELRMFWSAIRQLEWPDGKALSQDDAKGIVYRKYGIDSLKNLKRGQLHEVMDVLGLVAAGRLTLKRNPEGNAYIARPPQTGGAK